MIDPFLWLSYILLIFFLIINAQDRQKALYIIERLDDLCTPDATLVEQPQIDVEQF